MTQEQKELLIKDLCARLPYDVNVLDDMGRTYKLQLGNSYLIDLFYGNGDYVEVPIRPYLRSLSSMTEEEKSELKKYLDAEEVDCDGFGYSEGGTLEDYISSISYSLCDDVVDWLNKNMFDHRRLIPKGLALEATKDMYQQLKTK